MVKSVKFSTYCILQTFATTDSVDPKPKQRDISLHGTSQSTQYYTDPILPYLHLSCHQNTDMNSAKTEPSTICHMVAVPYPGRGHINAMMNSCKLLASKGTDILISFVITEEWLGFIGSDPKPANIRFATVPNCIPSEKGRGKDFAGFVKAVNTKMEAPFEELLDRLEPPVKAIVADTHIYWSISMGNRKNIPVASLFPMPAMVFSMFYHFELIVQNRHFPVDLSGTFCFFRLFGFWERYL